MISFFQFYFSLTRVRAMDTKSRKLEYFERSRPIRSLSRPKYGSRSQYSKSILCMKIIIVCFYENLTKLTNELSGQNVKFLSAESGGTYSKRWALNGPNMNHFRHNCPVSVTIQLFFLHIMSWFQRDAHKRLGLALIQTWKVMWQFVHRAMFNTLQRTGDADLRF